MTYEVTCPLGHRLQVAEAHFGQQVNCPTCGESFVVPDLSGAGQAVPPYPNTSPPYPATRPRLDPRRGGAGDIAAKVSRFSLLAGRPMVAVGLALVLMARGCDNVGKRAVDRAEMKVKAAEAVFDEDWQRQQLDLREKIAAIEDKKEPKAEDQKTLAELKTQLAELPGRQDKARKVLENGSWRDLKTDARAVKSNQQINGYWREIFFVFASILLTLGLLTVSWTAQGAERWVSLVMLAIITFSLYIGGAAWGAMGRL